MTLAWHFLYQDHKLRDGTVAPPDGEWLEIDGPIQICNRGLHASIDPFDALKHAPGPILCRVECDGDIMYDEGQLVCRRRRILRRMDATDMLRYFGRMQVVSVLHLWKTEPPDVVLDWLMTGDNSLRPAAESAAWSTAWSAARSAARLDFNALVHECFELDAMGFERIQQ